MLQVFLYKPRLRANMVTIFQGQLHLELTPSRSEFLVRAGHPHLLLSAQQLLGGEFVPMLLRLLPQVVSACASTGGGGGGGSGLLDQPLLLLPRAIPAPFACRVDLSCSLGLLYPTRGVAGLITVQLVDHGGAVLEATPSVNCQLAVTIRHVASGSALSASSSSEPSPCAAARCLLARATPSGTFEVMWIPQQCGLYDVSLLVSEVPIRGSPHRCVCAASAGGGGQSLGLRQTAAGTPLTFHVSHYSGDIDGGNFPTCCDDVTASPPLPVLLFNRKPLLPHNRTGSAALADRNSFVSALSTGEERVHPISVYSAYGGARKWLHLSSSHASIHFSPDVGDTPPHSTTGARLKSTPLGRGHAQARLWLDRAGTYRIFASCPWCNAVLRIHWREGCGFLPPSDVYVVPGPLSAKKSVLSVMQASEMPSAQALKGEDLQSV